LGEKGLTAGRFYAIYNPDVAAPIEDEVLRRRFESKRDADLAEIHGRMEQVEVERAYRIVSTLEKTARDLEEKVVPFLTQALRRWHTRVLWGDIAAFGLVGAIASTLLVKSGLTQTALGPDGWLDPILTHGVLAGITAVFVLIFFLIIHFGVRALAQKTVLWQMAREAPTERGLRGDLAAAFRLSTRHWRSIFFTQPSGWNRGTRNALHKVIRSTNDCVQALNDRFTNPSGMMSEETPPAAQELSNSAV
jgi:hypothetical protein